MDVREIIETWLQKNNYNGLYNNDALGEICCCEVGELCPCHCQYDVMTCEPGVYIPTTSEYDFAIGPRQNDTKDGQQLHANNAQAQ